MASSSSTSITIPLTKPVEDALKAFTSSGFAGTTIEETAAEMLLRGIEDVSSGDGLIASALRASVKQSRSGQKRSWD